LAEGWAAVAAGQTEPAKLAKGRANSELRDSPTRAKRGAAPKQVKKAEYLEGNSFWPIGDRFKKEA